MYIDKIDDIVKEYNKKYHTSIKMKPVDITDNTYIDFKKEVNDEDPKFKVSDYVRIFIYNNIFAKGYTSNWSEEIFLIELKIQYHGRMLVIKRSDQKFIIDMMCLCLKVPDDKTYFGFLQATCKHIFCLNL